MVSPAEQAEALEIPVELYNRIVAVKVRAEKQMKADRDRLATTVSS